jgi:excinuclease ABC subunit C
MESEADRRNFEEAARLRDRIAALEKIAQRQTAVSTDRKDRDVISVRADRAQAVGVVLKVREGKLVGKEVYRLSTEGHPSEEEILTSFLEQYVGLATDLAAEVVLEAKPADAVLIEQWLRKAGGRIRILSPKRGTRRDLVRMAAANAQLALATAKGGRSAPRIVNSIKELARWLNLPALPVTIEAFDISTTQGAQPVGSRVFFKNGRPVKGLYRHYAIQTVDGQDDFAMMREVVRRSWTHVEAGEEGRPDLVLIDGGKGQVASAIEGMRDAGTGEADLPPVVGIAKRLDELHLPDRREPVQIPHASSALRLLQRVRDEAHRFAISYHRKLRKREGTKSVLEGIPGIGPVLARRLLTEFGSLEGLRSAGASELVKAKGMTARRADAVMAALAGESGAEGSAEHP